MLTIHRRGDSFPRMAREVTADDGLFAVADIDLLIVDDDVLLADGLRTC